MFNILSEFAELPPIIIIQGGMQGQQPVQAIMLRYSREV